MATRVEEQETGYMREVLEEVVNWVRRLKDVGVSADKAAEVAQNVLLASLMAASEGFEESDFDEYDDEEE